MRLRVPRLLVWVARAMAVLLVPMVCGAVYESLAERADARAFPPPGQMVDIGGHRLHLNCIGTGSPTVVIDAGWGDWSASWSSWVQPEVAKTTQVCTYDRPGTGYSEPGPLPRTAEVFARELRSALTQAGIPAPYVLVGHSMGGLTVRVFAHAYASEVAGVVLIDSMSPGPARPSAPTTPSPTILDTAGDWLLTLPARIGLVRLLAGPLHLDAGLSPQVANVYTAFSVTPRSAQTWIDEGRGMPESMAQAGAVTSFGAIPLIVLSRGLDQKQDWQQAQTDLLHLSANSQQLIATQSGHNIQVDQPEAAIGAIVQVVELTRRTGSR